MIRPEVRAALLRWREALVGAGAVLIGLWLWLGTSGLPALFGAASMAVGVVLTVSGLRAARFRGDGQSPGIVETVEGRITYMGPETGGVVALTELSQVTFVRAADGSGEWHLAQPGQSPLAIPERATGAERLLDALAPLPGLDAGAMVRAVQTRTPQTITVWRRTPLRALT
ncbi:hypothetical protein [Jannaschia marina]|uniref:hypothetical protein n=1 Tax=Jannaschia marina TaxID=2741674 RepID=UPI0015CE5624|nr:hypothetical protein [Jannaschia marina]